MHCATLCATLSCVAKEGSALEDREDFYTFLHTHHIPMTTLEVLQRDRATSERLGF